MDDTIPELTSQIVQSYVENNKLPLDDLATLIRTVHGVLGALGQVAQAPEPEFDTRSTAAQIRKSITPEKLISFIDGKGYSLLKRHLTTHGLTPADYRARFGLPSDYPIVAPNYRARRSALALKSGLGRKVAPVPVGRL